MFEDKTYENILESMLSNVPDTIDKREGSIIYDAIAPCAIELANLYVDLDMLIDESFADTASYYYLVKRAAERGVFVEKGTPAVLEVVVTPADFELESGTVLNIGELNYYAAGNNNGYLDEGHWLITCEGSGTEGNASDGDVIPLDYLEGLESIEIYSIYNAGTDDEGEDSLRERYIDSFRIAAFGGNKADYKETIKSIMGVGGCKVYSANELNEDAGHVKCVITDSEYGVPSNEIISNVQQYVDPTQNGDGMGTAPCGHIVTIEGVKSVKIAIKGKFILKDTSWEDVANEVQSSISNYLVELSRTWDDCDNLIIRRSKIESIIIDIKGIDDVENLTINNSGTIYEVDKDSVPILESVSNG